MEFIINQRRVALFENLAFTNMTVSHERVVGMPSFRQIGDCLTAIRVFRVEAFMLLVSIAISWIFLQTSSSFFPMISVFSKPSLFNKASLHAEYFPSPSFTNIIAADVLAASHKMSSPVTGIEEEEEEEEEEETTEIYFF